MLQRGVALFHRIGPYGMAAATQAGTSFVVLPLLLLLIGADSYGRFALLEPLVAVLAQVLLLGAHQGLMHAICKEGANPLYMLKRTLLGAQMYVVPLLAIGFGLMCWWQDSTVIAGLFSLALYLEAMNLVCLTTVRALGDAWPFFGATLARSMTMLAGILVAGLVVGRGVLDERFALGLIAAGTALSLIGLLVRIARNAANELQAGEKEPMHESMKKSVRYGFPLVLAGLCQSAIALADRYILGAFVSPAALTGYVVSVKVANAMNLVATPVNLWWPTARFAHMQDSDGGQAFFRGAAVKIGAVYGVVAILLIIASPWLLPILGPGVIAEPAIASLLVVAAFLQAFQVVLNVGLLSAGQTKKTFYIAASVAVVHVAGCLVLIPALGAVGAAIMGVVSALVFASTVYLASQRVACIQQNFRVIGVEFGCVVLAALSMFVLGGAR